LPSSSEGSDDEPSVNEDGSGESPSDDSSSGGSDYQEEVGPNRSTGSGRRAGSKVGKGKQDDKKSWIEKDLAYQEMYDKWERQPRRLDVLVLAKPMPVERDGQEGTSPSGESAPVSRTSKPSALETINVIIKPSTVNDISNQWYELVAQFEVSVGNNFKLGHLRKSVIRGAVSHGQYRNLIGCRSSIFYRPKGARTKSVTFLKDTKSLFGIVSIRAR